jgi:zinc ribbon protein
MEPSPLPNLIACPDCGHRISKSARACPNCGAPPPRRKVKLRDVIIILATGVWGGYHEAAVYRTPIIYGVIGGLITGVLLAVIVNAVIAFARLFREKAPRAASITGTIVFWLGTAIAILSISVGVYAALTGASARLAGSLIGLGVLYGLIGWGVRYALSGERKPI